MISWLESNGHEVFEKVTSSIHIGFELGVSLMRGKPVIIIFQKDKEPVLINQAFSGRLVKSEYQTDNLEDTLEWCFEEAEKLSNKRFTFYIDPEIESFLDKVAESGDKSRSEYIRNLIKKEIK